MKQEGIKIVGQYTDGDSRAFKVMRLESGLIYSDKKSICDIAEFKDNPEIVYMQDTMHILVNVSIIKNRYNITIPMGNYVANISYLKILINNLSKDQHGLTLKDIYSIDKMNFVSVLRINQ